MSKSSKIAFVPDKGAVSVSASEARILDLIPVNGETYGYELVRLSDGALDENTVYIFLKRMQSKGLIETEWKTVKVAGRPMPRKVCRHARGVRMEERPASPRQPFGLRVSAAAR